MSETIYDYLRELTNDIDEIFNNEALIVKACYTGCLSYVKELFNTLKSNDKIKEEILKTHEKINHLIESFNKDTNYKFKKVFKNRNNYCDEENFYCDMCKNIIIISCINHKKYKKLNKGEIKNNTYHDLIINIIKEIEAFTDLKLI